MWQTRLCLLLVILLPCTVLGVEGNHHENHVLILSAKTIKKYNIKTEQAGKQEIQMTRDVLGKIVPDANKTIFIYPRYSGIIKKLTKFLGDKVKKGELLAEIESNQTLQTYAIHAPFSGYIIKKEANVGEFVKTGSPVYQLANLSFVWVHLFIYRKNVDLIKKGQKIIIYNEKVPEKKMATVIDYVSPLGVEHNQTMLARATLPNDIDKLIWIPGLYVDARVVVASKTVPVAVRKTAVQTLGGKKVVFIKTAGGFVPRACQFGIEGRDYIEVLQGIKAGQDYVVQNSFILKAEMEKESVGDDH
ncbi:efflux RND transporter periplasmic adaptor subunit [Legionella spiritensis]|uniref:HelB protein n=1 Tax=Legionella spiritensis TaxID=452 RepID=A0A0W0YY09_LEGSP|nr:efflux RND transporter periplasmic adaptor subunit [Legionella spiritensis]KTD61720.1 HelB protein [Legionella spiritensis]SNV38773.1 HelB protein [Legionella spiritensis]